MRVSSFALLTILALHGCSRGVDPVVEAETATFVVDPVSAVGEEATGSETFANVPKARLLNFTACVKDVAVLEPISNVPFVISEAGREIKRTTSDAKGCLYWSETVAFDAASQETYSEVERTITAGEVHKGRVSLRLALNPWKKGGESLRDLRFQSAPLKTSSTAQKSEAHTGLVIESVGADLEIVRSADAVAEANLQLSFEPKLQRLALDGGVILENLNSGKFLVRVQLLAHSADSVLPLSAIEEFKDHTFTKGTIQLRSRVKILRKIPRESSIELSFEAVPLEAPESLKPVKGRVSLGRLTSLSVSKSAPLRLEPELNFLAALPAANQQTAFGFELGKVRAEEVVVKELDSSGNPRLLEVELVTCLRNSISQEKIQGQPFVLQAGEQIHQLSSDAEEGCLRWKQVYPFDFHAKESFLKVEIQVQSANEFYGKEKIKRAAHLNLWKFAEPAQLVVDEEYEGVPSSSVADAKSGSELMVPNAMFSFMGRTFSIDAHLNLSTTRKYRFEIQPKIRRLSRDKGWLPPMGTGNGRYQIRFLLETNDANNPQVVSAQTVEAESRADLITSTVDFTLDDIRLVSTRLNLTIQVLPLDGARSLDSKPYTGPFDMGGFSVRLEPRAGKIDDRMKLVRANSALSRKSAEIFAQSNKHEWITPQRLSALGSSLPELDAYLQNGNKKGIAKLCSLFFDPNGWFSSYGGCAANPDSYLVLQKTEHVKQVKSSKLSAQPQSSALSISAGINFAEFESDDESKGKSRSYSVDSGLRLGVPLLNALGLNIGVGVGVADSWNSSKSFTKGKSRGAGRSGDVSKQILVDEARFEISGEVESCLLLAERSEPKKVYMACGSPRAKSFQESYYLLYQPAAASALLDPGANLAERPFLSLVRGTARFQSFVKTLQDPEVTLNFSKTLPAPADVMREAENRYDGFFPGLLTPTE